MMAGSSDCVQLLQNINQKLQHVNDCFVCFKEDFENVAFVGNNIKMRLKDCCIDMIVPFDNLLDKLVDILTAMARVQFPVWEPLQLCGAIFGIITT